MADFDLAAKKQKKLQEQRRKDALKKLESQRRQEAMSEEIESQKRAREEELFREQLEREARREQDLYETGGIQLQRKRLRVVPDARIDDKVVLPQSCFEDLEKQHIFDEAERILTFEVTRSVDPSSGRGTASSRNYSMTAAAAGVQKDGEGDEDERNMSAVDRREKVATTHCGVAEFTAEEGTIRFGPKVLFSLRHGELERTGADVEFVDLRYVVLKKYPRCRCTFQPRGFGFFDEKTRAEIVNLDLRGILEKQLQFHTCLTEGDIVPVRDAIEGKTFFLAAKVLEPDDALILINTEMEIEVLPSEQVEYEKKLQERREEQLKRKQERLDLEIRRRREWEMENPAVEQAAAESRLVEIHIRLPSGKTVARPFPEAHAVHEIFHWINNLASTLDYTYNVRNPYELVQSWPGHHKVFSLADKALRNQSLKDAGLNGRREQLYFKMINSDDEPHEAAGAPPSSDAINPLQRTTSELSSSGLPKITQPTVPTLPQEWDSTGAAAFEQMDTVTGDTRVHDDGSMSIDETGQDEVGQVAQQARSFDSVGVFHLLMESPAFRERGHSPPDAAKWSKKWGAQLLQLQELGYGPETWVNTCIPLLEKWNGTMHRVMNGLLEMAEQN